MMLSVEEKSGILAVVVIANNCTCRTVRECAPNVHRAVTLLPHVTHAQAITKSTFWTLTV
jgi:hypothetical protein